MIKTDLMVFVLLAASVLVSCRKENAPEPFLHLGNEIGEGVLNYDNKGTVYKGNTRLKLNEAYAETDQCPRISLYSNLDEWEIVPQYEDARDWIFVWPDKGSGCGRFWISVDANDLAEDRSAVFNVMQNGRILECFTICQTGAEPYLELDMGGVSRFNVAAEPGYLDVRIKTNTLWRIDTADDSIGWVSFSDITDGSLRVNVAENDDDNPRSCEIVISRADDTADPLSVSFCISQIGGRDAFSKASPVSVNELLSTVAPGSTIDRNVYLEGVVTSEFSKYNLEEHYLHYVKDGANFKAEITSAPIWLQDAAGDGLCVEFLMASDCVYPAGTHMKIHLAGHMLAADDKSGVLKVTGLTSAYIHDAVPGAEARPVEVYDVSSISRYENMLVTLKDVQFAMPYGTYFNTDVRYVNLDYSDYPELVDASVRQYPHILFDRYGNSVRLFSSSAFLDRHSRIMPKGRGDVTGIISRRLSKNRQTEFYIRLRSDADNMVSEDVSSAFAKTLVRFGPYASRADMSQVKADEGSATIKTSVFSSASAATSSVSMYFNAYSTVWKNAMENVGINTMAISPSPENQYVALNSQQWYNATGTSLTDSPGEAWIITANTLDAGTGHLYLIFSNASYSSGPKDFVIEWAENESAPVNEWKKIAEYEACSWNANWQSGEFMFALPDELKGKEKAVIRHRVTSSLAVGRKGMKINSTGTNRMIYWSIVEI